MALNSLGDLYLGAMFRTRTTAIKENIDILTQELATGLKSDTAAVVEYDFSSLSDMERQIKTAENYLFSVAEAELFTQTAQTALQSIQTRFDALTPHLTASQSASATNTVPAVTAEADNAFRQTISHLNQTISGRSVFAGQSTDQPPLADAELILNALVPVAAGSTTAADWQTALDVWFAPGGDYDTIAYLGNTTPLDGFLVDEGERVAFDVTAQDPAIRDALKSLVHVALLEQTGFASDETEMTDALRTAYEQTLSADSQIAVLRGEVGMAQADIETASVRILNEKTALEIARNDLLVADPYETATKFEETMYQLESLYTITARVSNLKLTDYL